MPFTTYTTPLISRLEYKNSMYYYYGQYKLKHPLERIVFHYILPFEKDILFIPNLLKPKNEEITYLNFNNDFDFEYGNKFNFDVDYSLYIKEGVEKKYFLFEYAELMSYFWNPPINDGEIDFYLQRTKYGILSPLQKSPILGPRNESEMENVIFIPAKVKENWDTKRWVVRGHDIVIHYIPVLYRFLGIKEGRIFFEKLTGYDMMDRIYDCVEEPASKYVYDMECVARRISNMYIGNELKLGLKKDISKHVTPTTYTIYRGFSLHLLLRKSTLLRKMYPSENIS